MTWRRWELLLLRLSKLKKENEKKNWKEEEPFRHEYRIQGAEKKSLSMVYCRHESCMKRESIIRVGKNAWTIGYMCIRQWKRWTCFVNLNQKEYNGPHGSIIQ